MKLQNLALIFIIIIIPIILVVSYYMSLQIDTLNIQTSYNTKLLESTKEAIEAFEINTVEWNYAYSSVGDSKRRDIMASIDTFITSFANNLGVGGTNREYILEHIPAIAYTLYDGYYIYSPTDIKLVVKDEDGVAVFLTKELVNSVTSPINNYTYRLEDEGKILYKYDINKGGSPDGEYNGEPFTLDLDLAITGYKHTLKPFTTYSARYKRGNIDVVVNYTLDNYIKVTGVVDGNYVEKSGYLIDVSSTTEPDVEELKEYIWDVDENKAKEYTYVYSAENRKIYFDDLDNAFIVDARNNKSELINVEYKKLILDDGVTTVYQALNNNEDNTIEKGKWYKARNSTVLEDRNYNWIKGRC